LETLLFAQSEYGTGVWVWAVVTALVGLVWLKRHLDLNRGSREPILRADEPGISRDALPPLTMLVAGKDEEANIGRCAAGMLAQDYPRLQIVLVNDRSGDRTGAILDELAARDARVSAVHVTSLPPGWFGKNNAMNEGVRRATGQWLCFSDADCNYVSPGLLSAAVRFAIREEVDFLSVLPRLEAATFWERVIQPVAGAVMVYWFPPQKVNSTASPRAYANGAFMLMRRDAYDRIGGHEPVRATLNEDMHMARRAKQCGLRLRVIRGGDLYSVRMYVGFRQIWRGWSRIFYGCFGTLPRLLMSAVVLAVFSVSPWVTLLAGLLAGVAPLTVAGAFTVLAQQSVLVRYYRLTEAGAVWSPTYPLGAAVCLGMVINAMGRLGGVVTTVWRGTSYTGGATAGAPAGTGT